MSSGNNGKESTLVSVIAEFIQAEQAAGISLLTCALLALWFSNSTWSHEFIEIWQKTLTFSLFGISKTETILEWINSGLMTIFFFYITLEIKRELVEGELSDPRVAALPVAAAIGGMILPIIIYLLVTFGTDASVAWGTPMATDIAFSIGALALLGKRTPPALKMFLVSLALVDDIGAIVVVAVLSVTHFSWLSLSLLTLLLGILFLLNRRGVRQPLYYIPLGIALWLALVEAGVHATLSGVVLAMAIPASVSKVSGHNRPDTDDPLTWLENLLTPWIVFVVLPLFALANGTMTLPQDLGRALSEPIVLGLLAARIVGKVVGIPLFAWLAVRSGLAAMPDRVGWKHIHGSAWLAGIGFTMALYMADLVLEKEYLLNLAKAGVLLASLVSGCIGCLLLAWAGPSLSEKEGREA